MMTHHTSYIKISMPGNITNNIIAGIIIIMMIAMVDAHHYHTGHRTIMRN
jgi:hypothetical protein